MLEHADGFATAFARALLGQALTDLKHRSAGSLDATFDLMEVARTGLARSVRRLVQLERCPAEIRTQVYTPSGRIVDLEVRLRPDLVDRTQDLVIWVEVKHGAAETAGQLKTYVEDLDDMQGTGQVIMLAPANTMPTVAPEVPRVTWQAVARLVEREAHTAARDSKRGFVLDAYLDYLREEQLMDHPLDAIHVLAIQHGEQAQGTLVRLCEETDKLVQSEWGTLGSQHKKRGKAAFGPGWSAGYELQRSGDTSPGDPRWRGGVGTSDGLEATAIPTRGNSVLRGRPQRRRRQSSHRRRQQRVGLGARRALLHRVQRQRTARLALPLPGSALG